MFVSICSFDEGWKKVDRRNREDIYEEEGSRQYKSDLLTGMVILSGLVSGEIPLKLIERGSNNV